MEQLIVKKRYGSFLGFEGAKNADRALPYDFIIPTNSGCSLSRRNEYPALVGILQTTGSKYGFTGKGNSIYLCNPLDDKYPAFYIGSKIVDRVKNKLITFKFDSWPENSEFPKGAFVDLLGDCGDYQKEKTASLLKASPYKWPKVMPEIIKPSSGRYRIDAPTINIDPDGCKDVDDCISLWDNKLAISIADVSAWVEANPFLSFAENIGTSLYENSVCVKPMFPRELSENLMSLIEGEERLAYSLIITFDKDITYEFKETSVKVTKSYTYDTVYSCKEIDIDLLKNYIARLSGSVLEDSHKWVEVLMLYYNTKAGEILKNKKAGILRNQKGINLERAKLFEAFSSQYMYLAYESAKYCLPSDTTFHSMLETDSYAHASSPIRRYVDIINQFALKNKVFEHCNLERFNDQQTAAKVYERELVFLDLYYNKERVLDGIVLNSESIFVTQLKKVIAYENTLEPKTLVKLQYYTNKQKTKWKERIVFKCVNTNSQQ
jgi:exoribonuclease R